MKCPSSSPILSAVVRLTWLRAHSTDRATMYSARCSYAWVDDIRRDPYHHARSALDVANALQHRRTATFRGQTEEGVRMEGSVDCRSQ